MSVLAGTPVGNQFADVFQLLPDVGYQYLVLAGMLVGVAVGVLVGVFVGVFVGVVVGVSVGVVVGVSVGVAVGVGVPTLSRVMFLPLLLEYETFPKTPLGIVTDPNVLAPKDVLLLRIV